MLRLPQNYFLQSVHANDVFGGGFCKFIYGFVLVILISAPFAIAQSTVNVTGNSASNTGNVLPNQIDLTDLRALPVQEGGRVKPLDTLAREALRLVYGKPTFNGKDAVEIVMTWLLLPSHWDQVEFIQIQHAGLKKALNLEPTRTYFTPKELMMSDRLNLVFQDLENLRKQQAKLDNYFQAVQRMQNQMITYNAFTDGTAIAALPSATSINWISLKDMDEPTREKFRAITQSFVDQISGRPTNMHQAVEDFKTLARAQNIAQYPQDAKIKTEVHFNRLHPFQWAWIFYLTAAICFVLPWIFRNLQTTKWALLSMLIAFILHTYGFALRIYLTERPPVSNMYESVVWVSWGGVLFAFLLERFSKQRWLLFAGCTISALCMILADVAPTILDSSLQPLQPVLRSNLWLTVHVLTITLSYSVFFLAFILGDIGLFHILFNASKEKVEQISLAIYRCLQVGVVLLAAGTILGGVWADYSWGRFWGWDPKETWALIALLGYLALLHARLIGYVKQFGIIAGSVISFSLVIMAWYGVNYVLGAGLHSYGFGGGGVQYVSAFVLAHLLFVVYVFATRKKIPISKAS